MADKTTASYHESCHTLTVFDILKIDNHIHLIHFTFPQDAGCSFDWMAHRVEINMIYQWAQNVQQNFFFHIGGACASVFHKQGYFSIRHTVFHLLCKKRNFNKADTDNEHLLYIHVLDNLTESKEGSLFINGSSQVSFSIFRQIIADFQNRCFKQNRISLTFNLTEIVIDIFDFFYVYGNSRHGTHADNMIAYFNIVSAAVIGYFLHYSGTYGPAVRIRVVNLAPFVDKFHNLTRYFGRIMFAYGANLAHTVPLHCYVVKQNTYLASFKFP